MKMNELRRTVKAIFNLELEDEALDKFVNQWILDMRESGCTMMKIHGRAGLATPASAICFDSPQSYLSAQKERKRD